MNQADRKYNRGTDMGTRGWLGPTLAIAGVLAFAGVLACVAAEARTWVQAASVSPAASPTQKSGGKMKPQVATDLAKRLARYRRVDMPFQSKGLTAREQQMVKTLVDAAGCLEDIYWRQVDPKALVLYKSLAGSQNPTDVMLRRLLFINGSRFDLIDDNHPFVGTEPMSPGRGFYPAGLTRAQVEAFVKANPDQKSAIYSPFTMIQGAPDDLRAVPYHVAFREFLEPAAQDLRKAAQLSEDAAFAHFLQLRADALLSDDYYASDLAWLDLKSPKVDVIFAPYEVYDDGLLGVKTSYGAAVLLRNEEESAKLEIYQKYIPQLQKALPIYPIDLPSKEGHTFPMEVMDAPYRAGDLLHGYQAVADNLPNDPRVHAEKGTKKIFFKNFMDARVNYIILPVAKRLMDPKQAALASGDGYLAATLMHEISHGLGPTYARVNGKNVDIREAIGPRYSALEEAKADVVGMFCLKWLADHGAVPKENLPGYYASYVAGILRSARFGVGEAHGAAEMMEFNFLSEKGGIKFDKTTSRYMIQDQMMSDSIGQLAHELLAMEATGDRSYAEGWFANFGVMKPELAAQLKKVQDIPVDIEPVFALAPPLR
jgi:hypothetical protein